MSANTLAPVADRNRLIDTLRAIALFGVIVMNVMGMVMALVEADIMPHAGTADLIAGGFNLIVLQGKARCSFALLFGVGFGVMMERAGDGFNGFYLRRMVALFVFGLANIAFLFFGDILTLYAVMGLVLMLFRRWSERAILVLGLVLTFVPPLALGLAELIHDGFIPNLAGVSVVEKKAILGELVQAYRSPDYETFVTANFRHFQLNQLVGSWFTIVYQVGVLGLFLTGLWIARRGILSDVDSHRPLLRRVAWACLPIGLVLSVVNGLREVAMPEHGPLRAVITASYAGLPLLAFGYLAALSLWLSRGGAFVQGFLSPAGRMALTGYLASNAAAAFVWYGWGLGRMGRDNLLAMTLLGAGIYAAFCILSAVWLSLFRFGPMEWLWRTLSYARPQPVLRRLS